MKPVFIHDKYELETFLLNYPYRNFYHLGDLDDFFWPYTSWIGAKENDYLSAVLLLYSGAKPPALLVIENENYYEMEELLESSLFLLPKEFYCHLSPGLENVLYDNGYQLDLHGLHYKMALTEPERLDKIYTDWVDQLWEGDLQDILDLYESAYPGNWFDARMLETKQYCGARDENGALIAVAGIHVYSVEYQIAALGNITTHPDHRGQGVGTAVTARLCKLLRETVSTIGLNVKADNESALAVYEKLGFEIEAEYNEFMVTCI